MEEERWFYIQDVNGYLVEFEVIQDEATAEPVARSLKIWPKDDAPLLSLRDVRRLPLAAVLARAKAGASVYFSVKPRDRKFTKAEEAELWRQVQAARAPRGRPGGERSTSYYAELLQAERDLRAAGVEHPGVELARRKKVKPNAIYQQLYRARKLEEQRKGKR